MNMKIKTGAFALALTIVANVTPAQYPPASHLATRWWQWALETPASENPLTDTTGQFGAVNQSGRVWLLAGNPSGTTVRTITVPSGKALFFPILNVFDVEDGIAVGGGRLFLVPKPVQVAQSSSQRSLPRPRAFRVKWMEARFPLPRRTWSNRRLLVCISLPITSLESWLGFIIRRLIPATTFCFPRCLPGSTPSTGPARSRSSHYRWM